MKVLYVTADLGGCRWYRCLLPASELAKAGHEVLVAGRLMTVQGGEIAAPDPYCPDVVQQRDFDLVVLQRWMHQEAPRVIARARSTGQAVVNDVDDWFFGIPTANAGFAGTHQRTDPTHNVGHYRKVLAASSALTVSTPYLAKRLESLGVPIYVLRNRIDVDRYPPREAWDGPLRVGWVGNVNYRAPGDLAQIRGVIGPWMRDHPEARFTHVGSVSFLKDFCHHDLARWERTAQVFCEHLGINRARYDARPLCAIEELPAALSEIDVALAPLEDCPFNRAKSWVKCAEAGASGIPCVASNLPEYRHFGPTALACSAADWRAALDVLVDPATRTAAGLAAHRRSEELSISTGWPAWTSAYMQIVSEARAAPVLAPATSNGEVVRFPKRRARVRRDKVIDPRP